MLELVRNCGRMQKIALTTIVNTGIDRNTRRERAIEFDAGRTSIIAGVHKSSLDLHQICLRLRLVEHIYILCSRYD